MKRNSKKGFTLIELLAVIIILGVLMLIAIPSVTEYINNSRKSSFLASASSYIGAVTIKVNAGTEGLNLNDPTVAYYVAVSDVAADSCVSLEKGGKSPFGDWEEAYVVVIPNAAGTSYSYYFTALDDAGYGMTPMQEGSWAKDDVEAGSAATFPLTIPGTEVSSAEFPNLPGLLRDLTVQYVTTSTSCQ